MSDNGSIMNAVLEGIKDIGKGAVEQVTGVSSGSGKVMLDQITGKKEDTEEELKKKQQNAQVHASSMQIDARIQQIRKQKEEERIQQVQQELKSESPPATLEDSPNPGHTNNIALERAQTKMENESARAAKG